MMKHLIKMKRIVLVFIALIFSVSLYSQTSTGIKYFKDIEQSREVKEKKGVFIESSECLNDSIKRVTFKDIGTDRTIWIKVYKYNKPFGNWYYYNGNGQITNRILYGYDKPKGYYKCDVEDRLHSGKLVELNKEIPLVFKDKQISKQYEHGFMQWVAINVVYPYGARDRDIQGEVVVGFTIDELGTIGSVQIVKGVHELLDKESIKVVKQLPQFEPVKLNEKNIGVYIECPIKFSLE